ncbi:hypothetical protein Zmor_005486 [Zophobas morio]|uniref:C2H2-type domain-containing protein n=1 Tax=Zophobas morio TaxID=2755281 RepID=A0AA38IPZ7_9CUCU|nr:hypothetical protein Zmor_005486 [Zophobas morio]
MIFVSLMQKIARESTRRMAFMFARRFMVRRVRKNRVKFELVDPDDHVPKVEPVESEPGLSWEVNPETNKIVWRCDLCPKSYNGKSTLTRHRSRHFEPKHPCPKCGKQFHNDFSVKQHLFHVHSNQKDFICHICHYATLTKYSLQLHIIRKHTKDFPLSCDVCGKGYTKRHLLDAHRRSVHEGVEHACEECGKTFKYVHTLQNHRKLHTSSTKTRAEVKCELCGEKFKHLKEHMARVHVAVKTFVCEICGESFFTNNLLNMHVRRKHKNEKPFKCDLCFHAVFTKRELDAHVKRRHSDNESAEDIKEKPFQCSFCKSRFKASTSLIDHERKHTGEKAYSCNVCQEKFFSKYCLKSHDCGGITQLQMASK